MIEIAVDAAITTASPPDAGGDQFTTSSGSRSQQNTRESTNPAASLFSESKARSSLTLVALPQNSAERIQMSPEGL
jgi:hypothetical protein